MTVIVTLDHCALSENVHSRLSVSITVLRFVLFIWNKNLATHAYLYKRAKIVKIDM